MKFRFALILFFILSMNLSVVDANTSNLYTAIRNVNLIEPESPHIEYSFEFKFEVWMEREVDLSPLALNVSENTCLVSVGINSSIDLHITNSCLLRSTAIAINNNNYSAGVTEISIDDIIIQNGDMNASLEVLPEGNISIFLFPSIQLPIFGEFYNMTIVTINGTTSIYHDDLPPNYGQATDSEIGIFNAKISASEDYYIYKAYPREYSNFKFEVFSEVLNTGQSFEIDYPNTCTNYVTGNTSFEHGYIPIVCAQSVTKVQIPGKSIVQYTDIISFYFNESFRIIPDGKIYLINHAMQPKANTFGATLVFSNGAVEITYEELPSFWSDYPIVSRPLPSDILEETLERSLPTSTYNNTYSSESSTPDGWESNIFSANFPPVIFAILLLPILLKKKR